MFYRQSAGTGYFLVFTKVDFQRLRSMVLINGKKIRKGNYCSLIINNKLLAKKQATLLAEYSSTD